VSRDAKLPPVQPNVTPLQIGILALQGDYDAHKRILTDLGATTRLVRSPHDLEGLDGLLIPGGESTVMSRLCERYGLSQPLQTSIESGLPVFGTCAGLIFLAREIEGGSLNFPQTTLGVLDVLVARNAYGAQIDSFETDLNVPELDQDVRAIFIRAPQIKEVGANVEILALHEGAPVLVRQNRIMALSFHPEIAGEGRIHQMWLDGLREAKAAAPTEEKQ
jgi:5'-phosphate synthase pdxT subunit